MVLDRASIYYACNKWPIRWNISLPWVELRCLCFSEPWGPPYNL